MIRLATLKDKEAVLSIYNEAKKFIKTYNSPQWQDGEPNIKSFISDLNNKTLYVNEQEEKIVAVATLMDYEETYENIDGTWLNDDKYIVIHRIATKKDQHKKGYAKDFLDFIINDLKYKNIKIDTHELNLPMKKFLIKNGFVYCGIIYLNKESDRKRLAYQKTISY